MPSYPELTVREASEQIERFRIIDVRQEHEFNGPLGRIENAELVPLGRIAEEASTLGEAPLLLVCRSGGRSGKACEILIEQGVTQVTNLAGGMIGWCEAELPVERTKPATTSALLENIAAYFAQVGGIPSVEANEIIARLLEAAGAAAATADPSAVRTVLDGVVARLGEGGAPPDLELSRRAFLSDLEAL